MAYKKQETINKHNAIRARYDELCKVTVEGMRLKHTDIINKIAAEFYAAATTIERIILEQNNK